MRRAFPSGALFGVSVGNVTAGGIQNQVAVEVSAEPGSIPAHGIAGDHQTGLTDEVGVDLSIGGVAAVDHDTQASILQNLELGAGVVIDIGTAGKHDDVHIAHNGNGLALPLLDVFLDLLCVQITVVLVGVGVAGNGVTLVTQSLNDLLGTGNFLLIEIVAEVLNIGSVAAVTEDTFVTGDSQSSTGAAVREVLQR